MDTTFVSPAGYIDMCPPNNWGQLFCNAIERERLPGMSTVEVTAAETMIRIEGARTHNLKNVSLDIAHNALTVLTGVSGSGKSSLAFDTLYAEGQRQYIASLSTYARQFLNQMQRPEVDSIQGLQPTLCIDQRAGLANPRSTVATVAEIYDYLRLLMARVGTPSCTVCDKPILQQSPQQILEALMQLPEGTKLVLTGDATQIDNPYLDSSSNGLSYLVERLKDKKLVGHITLAKSERSELASLVIAEL